MSEFDAIYDDIWRRLQSGEAPGLSGYDDQLSDLFSQGRLSGPEDIKRLVEMGEEPAAAEPDPEQPDGISEEERHSLSLKMSETADRPSEREDKSSGESEPEAPKREDKSSGESEPGAPQGTPAGGKQSGGSAGLSEDDRRLLLMRLGDLGDAINNKELFGRWAQLKMGYHPDTGEKFNVRKERKSAMQASAAELARNLKKREVDESTPKVPDTTRGESAIDVVQSAGDVGGVVDQTGITDALNAMLSIGRAVTDKGRRSEHLQNAAISAAGVIPLIGDLPKLLKLGRTKRNMQAAAGLAGGRRGGGVGSGVSDFLGRSVDTAEAVGGMSAGGGGNSRSGGRAKAESVVRNVVETLSGESDRNDRDRDSQEAEGGRSGGSGEPPKEPPRDGSPPMGDPPGSDDDAKGVQRSKDVARDFTEKIVDMTLAVGKVTSGILGMVEGVRLLNKGNLFLNRHLAQLNAEIARSEALREVAGVRRSLREGETMSGAMKRASEADIAIDDVRSRFVTPVQAAFTDVTAAGTKLAASFIDAADSILNVSGGLEVLAKGVGKVSEAASSSSNLEFFYGPEMEKRMEEAMKKAGFTPEQAESEGGSLPWNRFLNDVADGKFDGKSDAGFFFGLNEQRKRL